MWSVLCFALFVGGVVDLAVGAAFWRGDVRMMAIVLGAIAGPLLLDRATGRTIVTKKSLTTRSLLSKSTCAWHDIRTIELREERGRSYSAWIQVYLYDGGVIRLKAPFSMNRWSNKELDDLIIELTRRRNILRYYRS